MKKNIFDQMSDSYDKIHLNTSEITMGKKTISISAKLKLTLGWSLFLLCCIVGYIVICDPGGRNHELTQKEKTAVLEQAVDVNEEHDTMVPYEKDADLELNTFIEDYFNAITDCDNVALQDMVTDTSEYSSADVLKQKLEYITGYHNITVYTKSGLEEGSYIAFVVANISISGVNSSPYDIMTLYIVNGARGYLINNGILSEDTQKYIEKVKGDEDIQKIYRLVEEENNELKEKDPSLQNFFDMINGVGLETEMTDSSETESTEDKVTTESEE